MIKDNPMSSPSSQLADRLASADFTFSARSNKDIFVYDKITAEVKTRVTIMGDFNSIYIYEWFKVDGNSFITRTDFHNIDQQRQTERIYAMLNI